MKRNTINEIIDTLTIVKGNLESDTPKENSLILINSILLKIKEESRPLKEKNTLKAKNVLIRKLGKNINFDTKDNINYFSNKYSHLVLIDYNNLELEPKTKAKFSSDAYHIVHLADGMNRYIENFHKNTMYQVAEIDPYNCERLNQFLELTKDYKSKPYRFEETINVSDFDTCSFVNADYLKLCVQWVAKNSINNDKIIVWREAKSPALYLTNKSNTDQVLCVLMSMRIETISDTLQEVYREIGIEIVNNEEEETEKENI